MAYTTVDSVKAYLGITTQADDAVLTTLIGAAEAFVNAYTNRVFEAVTGTVVHTGADITGDTLWLADDLLTLTSVKANDESLDVGEMKLLGQRGEPYYAIISDKFIRFVGDRHRIEVTGTWGYSMTPPADIAHACVRLAAFYYRQRDAQVFDTIAMPGAGIITVPRGAPADVLNILERYRRRV